MSLEYPSRSTLKYDLVASMNTYGSLFFLSLMMSHIHLFPVIYRYGITKWYSLASLADIESIPVYIMAPDIRKPLPDMLCIVSLRNCNIIGQW